jgi:hypothetical protein
MGRKGSPFCVKPIWVKRGKKKLTFRNLTSPPLTKQSHYVFFKFNLMAGFMYSLIFYKYSTLICTFPGQIFLQGNDLKSTNFASSNTAGERKPVSLFEISPAFLGNFSVKLCQSFAVMRICTWAVMPALISIKIPDLPQIDQAGAAASHK